jgi:hypothetical protein
MDRPMRGGRLAQLAAIVAIAAMSAGCLGDAPASVAPTSTPQPEPTPRTTTYTIGTAVWYEGIVLHIDSATSVLDARGGPVDVSITIENPADIDAELQAKIYLRVGDDLVEPTRESVVPTIPAAGHAATVMTYELQGVSSVNDAGIQIGGAPDHIGFVPLTASGGSPVTLEPRELAFSGEGTAGELEITIAGGLRRWDLPDWSQELHEDRQVIIVDYDATFTGGFTGGFAFTGNNVALRLPDGTEVPPRADGHSQSVELIGAGKTKRGLFSRFEVPASVTGTIWFVVIDGDKEQEIPLVIPA